LDKVGNPTFSVFSQTISVAFPNKSVLGKETPPCTPEELNNSIVQANMEFETIQEPWNEYTLKDGTIIKTKAQLTSVSKTNKFQHYGEPIYLILRALNLEVSHPKH